MGATTLNSASPAAWENSAPKITPSRKSLCGMQNEGCPRCFQQPKITPSRKSLCGRLPNLPPIARCCLRPPFSSLTLAPPLYARHAEVGEGELVSEPRDAPGAGPHVEPEPSLDPVLAEAEVPGAVDAADDEVLLLAVQSTREPPSAGSLACANMCGTNRSWQSLMRGRPRRRRPTAPDRARSPSSRTTSWSPFPSLPYAHWRSCSRIRRHP